jgi:hypothetical protein
MQLQFAVGGTRFVILIGAWAIKIARPRPLRSVRTLCHSLQERNVASRLAKHDANFLTACIRYVFPGIFANFTESRFSETYLHPQIEPVVFSFLGLVNVMSRGKPVRPEELSLCPFQDLSERVGEIPDLRWLLRADQFARFGNEIRLIDYGNRAYAEVLETYSGTQPRLAPAVIANA